MCRPCRLAASDSAASARDSFAIASRSSRSPLRPPASRSRSRRASWSATLASTKSRSSSESHSGRAPLQGVERLALRIRPGEQLVFRFRGRGVGPLRARSAGRSSVRFSSGASLQPGVQPWPARQQRLVRNLCRLLAFRDRSRRRTGAPPMRTSRLPFTSAKVCSSAQRPSGNSRRRATRRVGPAVPSSRARRIRVAETSASVASPPTPARTHDRLPWRGRRPPGPLRCRLAVGCLRTRPASPRRGSARIAPAPGRPAARRHPVAPPRPAPRARPAQSRLAAAAR